MGDAAARVAGVAVLHEGRVLAARRSAPSPLAGGWELPGGKCEPGESLEEAAVREVREELGCEVRANGRLHGAEPIGATMTLEVVLAELVGGEPVPRAREHDAIRWLSGRELGDVRWLPADVPFLQQLAQHLEVPR